jgi:hypothetical protein
MIVEVLEHIFQPRLGPDAFFTFFSKEGLLVAEGESEFNIQ